MKPAAAVSTYRICLDPPPTPEPAPKPRDDVPRAARTLALAHRIDRMIRNGELRDLADAARRLGLTRARVTQIMNLTLLAPEIQEAVLAGQVGVSERRLRPIAAEPDWNRQLEMWRKIDGQLAPVLSDCDGA